MSRTTTVAVITCVLAAACTELPDVDRGVCGNHVVEAGEDCDGFAPEGGACAEPGALHECRFDCSAEACPDGWGCGLDGLCRQGAGFAEEPLGPWTFDVLTLDAADVDGDGRQDVVGGGRAGVSTRFGSADGRLDDKHDLAVPLTGQIAVGDMDGDGRADVLAPMDLGMLAYAGSEQRRLDPVPFAVFAQGQVSDTLHVATVGAVPDFFPITYLVMIQQGGMCFVQFCDLPGGGVATPGALDVDNMFPGARGQLDGALTGEEFVLAADGGTSAFLFDIERINPGSGDVDRPRVRQTVALPGPARSRPMLVDRDGDGDLDLLIGVESAGEVHVAVALNGGSGTFGVPAIDAAFDQFVTAGCGDDRVPLAAGDVTGDGAIEWVGDRAICVILPIFGFVAYAIPTAQSPLAEAVIADINRDGAFDVVAAYAAIDGLEVFLGSNGLLFNRVTVGTEQLPRRLQVGDFDGNYIDDVAFVRAAGPDPADGDEVSVLFGNANGVETAPTRIAVFGAVDDFLATDFLISASTLDRATDLIVLARLPNGDERGGGLLLGSSSRQMTSPLILDDANALTGAIRPFSSTDANDTLILAGTPSNAELPFSTFLTIELSNTTGQFRIENEPVPLPVEDFAPACAWTATGDFDGDGLDEVLFADHPQIGASCARDPGRPDPLDDGRLAYADPGETTWVSATVAGLTRPGSVATADVDADGDDDALVLYRGIDGEDTGAGLLLVRGGDGGPDLDGERIELLEQIDAAAALPMTPGQPMALALVSGDTLWLAEAGPDGEWLPPERLAVLEPEDGITGLIAADVDGDALDDVVLLRGGRVWVWLRVEAAPQGERSSG